MKREKEKEKKTWLYRKQRPLFIVPFIENNFKLTRSEAFAAQMLPAFMNCSQIHRRRKQRKGLKRAQES